MAAIFNSTTLDSAILHKNKLHSFILTQLDDGSHLEFCHLVFRHCHVGFRHCYLGFIHLVIFSQIHSKKHSHSTLNLTQTNLIWLKLIHSHLTWWWQPSWLLPSWDLAILDNQKLHLSHCPLNLTHVSHLAILPSWFPAILHIKKLHSFILTQIDDGSHLEFWPC